MIKKECIKCDDLEEKTPIDEEPIKPPPLQDEE